MRRPLIEGEDFETSIGQRKQAQGTVMEAYQERGKFLGLGKEKKKRISSYVWKDVVYERDVCKN